jgi:hypothetical protein
MFLKRIHEHIFNTALTLFVMSTSLNSLLNERVVSVVWLLNFLNVGLLFSAFWPTASDWIKKAAIAGQIAMYVMFAVVFEVEGLRTNMGVALALGVRLVDLSSNRRRSMHTDLGTWIDALDERIRSTGRRYRLGSICILGTVVVLVVSCFRVSFYDLISKGLRGQIAKRQLFSHTSVLLVISALGATDSKSVAFAVESAGRKRAL